ncbi:MAG: hypothetical protein NC210_06475 [[Clostridium] fimetarium]|nr:hypothetical protein [Alistipes timonensis]MCM1406048.1 hypothetical protein [[Clostridium] fimetarium]
MSLYHEFGTPTYISRRYSPEGEVIRDYDMIMNYTSAFPADARHDPYLTHSENFRKKKDLDKTYLQERLNAMLYIETYCT